MADEGTPQALPADFFTEVGNFTLQICTPIYWHDRRLTFPKEMRGGSCFILRFGKHLFGVTAAHALQAYRDARQRNPATVCQLRLMEFAFHDAIIDTDPTLDIATFSVSQDQLKEINGTPIDCTGQWPPPAPARMRACGISGGLTDHPSGPARRISCVWRPVGDRGLQRTGNPSYIRPKT
jgi:hypothetical protein